MSPRTGRPTDNPKGKPITIRLDNEAKTILDSYCLQENVDKGEAVRRGIKKLKDDLKEEQSLSFGDPMTTPLHTPKECTKLLYLFLV